jgi:hypothetical protein
MVDQRLFCSLAGAYLSLGYVSLFARQMNDERGLIALAAIFFAKSRPLPTTSVALMFGVAAALAVRLPEMTGAAANDPICRHGVGDGDRRLAHQTRRRRPNRLASEQIVAQKDRPERLHAFAMRRWGRRSTRF